MKQIKRETFEKWVKNLGDANIEKCLRWFQESKTFNECFDYLAQCWSVEEVANAFMKREVAI